MPVFHSPGGLLLVIFQYMLFEEILKKLFSIFNISLIEARHILIIIYYTLSIELLFI